MKNQLKEHFNTKPTNKEYKEIKIFFNSFIEAFLWAEELDENTLKDFEINCLKILYKDCRNFLTDNYTLIKNNMTVKQAGHDFLLTRNHHGAGFWDRGLKSIGMELSEESNKYREIYLFKNIDNKIYFE